MRGVCIAHSCGGSDALIPVLLSETGSNFSTRKAMVELLLPREESCTSPTPNIQTLQSIFSARQHIALDPARLGRWSYQLSCLRDPQALAMLIESGEGALRAWRGEDAGAVLDEFGLLYNDLNVFWVVANVPHGHLLLPLLMYAPEVCASTWIETHAEQMVEALRGIAALDAKGKFEGMPRCREAFTLLAGYLGASLPCLFEEAGALYAVGASYRQRSRGGAFLMASCALCVGEGARQVEETRARLEWFSGQGDEGSRWVDECLWKLAHLHRGDEAFLNYFFEEVCRPLRQSWLTSRSFEQLGEAFMRGCRTLDEPGKGGFLPSEMEHLRDVSGGKKLVYQIARALLVMTQSWAEARVPDPGACAWPSQGELWRAVWAVCQEDGEEALAMNAWVGEILWYEIEKAWAQARSKSANDVAQRCARILLWRPSQRLPGLSSCSIEALETIWCLGSEGDYEAALCQAWPWIKDGIGALRAYHARQVLKIEHLEPWEGRLILKHSFLKYGLEQLPRSVKQRRRVLGQIEQLERAEMLTPLDPGNGWLLKLLAQFDFRDGYALTVMAGKIARQGAGAVAARQIQALCLVGDKGTKGAARSIHDTFGKWLNLGGEFTCEAHRERASELAGGFFSAQEARGQIEQYLHHRRLLGEPEELSKNIQELLSQQGDVEGRASQARAIRALLDGELPVAKREKLVARLEKLSAPQDAGALRSIQKRASNLLSSSLEQVMQRSFDRALGRSMLDALEDLCGERYEEDRLSPELRVLLTVSQSEEFHLPLFKRYIQLALGSGDIGELEENALWANKIRAREGFDLEVWRAGFEHETSLGEKRLRIHTENDLIRGAQMGTGFDSCLSLEDGMYAMSALGHNMEMNKHVIYVRVASGEVIARKLVAIDKEMKKLVGYPVYCKDQEIQTQFAYLIDMSVARFAKSCGLELGDEGLPEPLIKPGFDDDEFYLDGVEPWCVSFAESKRFPEPPGEEEGWSSDLDAQMEWAYFDACARKDERSLSALAWRKRAPWSDLARGRLMRMDRALAIKHFDGEKSMHEKDLLSGLLWQSTIFSLDEKVRLMSKEDESRDSWDALEVMISEMPADREKIQAVVEHACVVLRQIDRSKELFEKCGIELYQCVPTCLANARVSTLIEYMKRLFELACAKQGASIFHAFVNGWGKDHVSRLLKLSWALHGPDLDALSRGLSEVEDELSLLCMCEVAQEVSHPMLVSPLRQLWKRRLRREVAIYTQLSLYKALRHQELDEGVREQFEEEALMRFKGSEVEALFMALDRESHAISTERTLRRCARRALESTAWESRAKRIDQITMPDMEQVLRRVGFCGGEAAATIIKEVARMCHVVDASEHERQLAKLLKWQEELGRYNQLIERAHGLEMMHALAHGSVEGIEEIFGQVEEVMAWSGRDGQSGKESFLRDYLWVLLGHRRHEPALMEVIHRRLPPLMLQNHSYASLRQLEAVLKWTAASADPRDVLKTFFDAYPESFWRTLRVVHVLCRSLLYWMGAEDEGVALCAAYGLYEVISRHQNLSLCLPILQQAFVLHHDRPRRIKEEIQRMKEVIFERMAKMDRAEVSVLVESYFANTSAYERMSIMLTIELLEGMQDRWSASCWGVLREDFEERATNNLRARALLRWLSVQEEAREAS